MANESNAVGQQVESLKLRRFGWAQWKTVLGRVKDQVFNDNISFVAAGVAFFIFLGLFPLAAAFIGIYGLIADPMLIEEQFRPLLVTLPQTSAEMMREHLIRFASEKSSAGLATFVGLALAIYSGSRATGGLMSGLNTVYGIREERSFIRFTLVSLALTFSAALGGVVVLGAVAVFPVLANYVGLESITESVINWLRWPGLFLIVAFSLAVLYNYAPNRKHHHWRWVTVGSVVGTILWLLASLGFSAYISFFGDSNKTYGSLAAVVVFLTWTYVSAFVVLIGAEIDAEADKLLHGKGSEVSAEALEVDRERQQGPSPGAPPDGKRSPSPVSQSANPARA